MTHMKEQLSALMDDELGDRDCDGCLGRLGREPELRANWDLYHLIGDALRGQVAAPVVERVRVRLVDEPTILAPRALRRSPRRSAWYAMSAAASVSAVALVGWLALPLFDLQPGAPGAPRTALTAPAQAGAAQSVAAVPAARGVTDYLLAHQRFSPSSAIGGIAPYIRTVAEEPGAR